MGSRLSSFVLSTHRHSQSLLASQTRTQAQVYKCEWGDKFLCGRRDLNPPTACTDLSVVLGSSVLPPTKQPDSCSHS
jgi:hypothetical protein